MNDLELLKIRTQLGKTQEDFAILAGVSPRTVQNWEAGKAIPKSKHAFLRGLLTGSNNLERSNNSTLINVINEDSEIYHNTNGNKFIELKNGKFKIIVKKVPVKAFGSYLSDFQSVNYLEELEEVSFTVDHLGKGKYMCFEVEGDSMNGGNLYDSPDGAELLCRELGKQHWKDGFRDSTYGWVIVHKQTVLFKDITGFDETTGEITCHSRSGLPNHPDFKINLNDVNQILKVIKRTF